MKTFCITGKLKDKNGNFLERDEAINLIENNCPDMRFVSGVSGTTTYLIVAKIPNPDKKTVKIINAEKLGAKVVSNKQMLDFIKKRKFN
jgi:NAD-dependent DNA ligase|tara:strand:+ start:259 stop:525 length:267 start_codon:yes stop_codon:yes gene_type:complete